GAMARRMYPNRSSLGGRLRRLVSDYSAADGFEGSRGGVFQICEQSLQKIQPRALLFSDGCSSVPPVLWQCGQGGTSSSFMARRPAMTRLCRLTLRGRIGARVARGLGAHHDVAARASPSHGFAMRGIRVRSWRLDAAAGTEKVPRLS